MEILGTCMCTCYVCYVLYAKIMYVNVYCAQSMDTNCPEQTMIHKAIQKLHMYTLSLSHWQYLMITASQYYSIPRWLPTNKPSYLLWEEYSGWSATQENDVILKAIRVSPNHSSFGSCSPTSVASPGEW